MLNRYKTLGLLSAISLLSFSSAASAGQSYQSVSGVTRASGENATSLSHSEQSMYQSGGGTQYLWQSVEAGTLSEGIGTTAATGFAGF